MVPCPSVKSMMTALRAGFQRADVVRGLAEALGARQWAWQGPAGAVEQWAAADDAKDLDLWCGDAEEEQVRAAVEAALPAARIEHADDPRRLRHTGWAVFTDTGLAVVDITFGDLRVGPLLLARGADIDVDSEHRLVGTAAAADLLVRPLLRGRIPGDARLEQARVAWAAAGHDDRMLARLTWGQALGPLHHDVVAVLEGAAPPPDLARRARTVLLRATVAPAGLAAAWKQRRSIVPAGRHAGPLGHRIRGVVVATVGTDGSGKSTVAEQTQERLRAVGLRTTTAYFGMARGNLPGVGLARRLLGIPEPGGEDKSAAGPEPAVDVDAAGPPRDHQALRRVAAYYYAVEYGWRYLSTVAGPRRRGEVVICDRYVYDLRESPWPGSKASVLAELLVPPPDIMVLPDAPAEMIHARKPERPLAEQKDQQEKFRVLLAERPGRCANLLVDTSGATSDTVGPLVRAIVSAAHLDPCTRP